MENPITDADGSINDPSARDPREEGIRPVNPPEIELPKLEPQLQLPPINTPGAAPAAPGIPTNAWAIVSLVASIASFVFAFGIGGVIGVIAGLVARRQIRESHGREAGDGLALAGIIVGGVNIVLVCLGLLCLLGLFGAGMAGVLSDMSTR
jgi:hypothetical protein